MGCHLGQAMIQNDKTLGGCLFDKDTKLIIETCMLVNIVDS